MSRDIHQQKEAERVTLVGSALDLVLGVAKIIIGIFSHSSALVVDGVHSLSDLATDAMVIVVLRLSHRAPDATHPWGHGRFETVGTVALGAVLIAVAGTMAYETGSMLFTNGSAPVPEWPALVVAGLSIIGKEWIFHYTVAVGHKLKSDLIIANAWHSRTDAFSSVVVLIGVGGAMMGIWWLDALAAVLVSLFVAKIGWDMTWDSVKELVDTALPEDTVQAFRDEVMQVDGVISVHSFKSRKLAGRTHLEMHLQVDRTLSASESHYIGDAAVARLLAAFDNISHVIFHIDTYDDEDEMLCRTLPMRNEVEASLRAALAKAAPELDAPTRISLFYDERIGVELFFANSELQPKALAEAIKGQMENPYWLKSLRVWSGHPK